MENAECFAGKMWIGGDMNPSGRKARKSSGSMGRVLNSGVFMSAGQAGICASGSARSVLVGLSAFVGVAVFVGSGGLVRIAVPVRAVVEGGMGVAVGLQATSTAINKSADVFANLEIASKRLIKFSLMLIVHAVYLKKPPN